MARAPMPAPQPLESPAVRRSAMLAKLLEEQRQPTQITGGYGELAARLLGQGIAQFSANKAEGAVRTERETAMNRQRDALLANLPPLPGVAPSGAALADALSPPPVNNTQEPVQAQIAPAASVAGTPTPPAAPAGMPAAPMPMADVPPTQPPQAPPAPMAAPPQPTPAANPLGPTPQEIELIRQAATSGDPGQMAWAQQTWGEIQMRMADPAAGRQEVQMVNGVPHYIDPAGVAPPTPVFPNGIPQEAQNETFLADRGNSYGVPAGTLLTRSPEGVVSVVNRQEAGYELGPNGRLQPIGGGPNDPSAGENRIRNERELRREYQSATQEYRTVRQAFQKVEASLAQGTGIGDVGGIFGVMKIFDPGSTVREGEAATVQNSGGVPENIRGLYNRVATGERLTPQQRAEIIAVGRAQFGTYEQSYQSRVADFTRMAQGYGIDPRNVVGSDEAPAPPAPSAPGAPRSPAPRRPAPSAPSAPRRSNGQTRRYNPNTGQLE